MNPLTVLSLLLLINLEGIGAQDPCDGRLDTSLSTDIDRRTLFH